PFLPELSSLEGELTGEVSLQGTLAELGAVGQLAWSGGAVRLVSNPTELDDIRMQLDFNNTGITVSGDGVLGGGPVEFSGSAGWRPQPGFDVAIRGSSNRLFYPPATELEASPDLRLVLAGNRLTLNGEVVVDSGVLAYEQLPPGSVTLSADVIEVDYAGNPLATETVVDLDARVRVRIKDKFRVKGKDLNVTVGGDLSLRKAPGRPLEMFGNLNVIGGEFNAYGQRLLVRQGRFTFTGLPENPEMNLRAEREIPADNVKAGVQVTGTLENPELSVYSDPVMSRTEALSYLVRGRGLDSGAGADGSALAASLGVSLVNQTGMLQELGRIPGLSNIEVGTEGSEQATTATLSGYIGERIYLSYGIGLYEPVNVLTARLYLRARLWLEVVSRLESSVDLYYSFDID
ncbi:MAG TPA: translocation/assembly module TamB domain-containing protein, partial [Kineobactrum sp.]